MKLVLQSLVVAVLLFCGFPAQAGSTTVYNGLPDAAINNLYLPEVNTADWEEDVLGNVVLNPGEEITITFYGGGCH